MITLRRDNVVKQTESEVVALALESQGFVREGAACLLYTSPSPRDA